MSHTYFCFHVHLVFSTKGRSPWLTPEVQRELFPYLAGAIRNQASTVCIVGGHIDHIHSLISPGRQVLIPDLVKEVKRMSSIWMKDWWPNAKDFAWQEGYGAFSVSHSNLGRVRRYIENQDEHHAKRTFAEEFRALLVRHGIEF